MEDQEAASVSATRAPTLPSLTSLRWFAATAVFLRHVAFGHHLSEQGATGVSFFFVLSGFVLAWAAGRPQGHWMFMKRRLTRIYPDYLVACLVAIPVLILVGRLHGLRRLVLALFPLTLLQSWVPKAPVFYGGLGVTWSLSDEAFFYVMFPLLMAWLVRLGERRRSGPGVGVGAVAIALAVAAMAVPAIAPTGGRWFWFTYINPATRLIEFALGMCLALLLKEGRLIRIPMMPAVVLVLVAYVVAGHVPIWAMWVATTIVPFCVLITAAAQADLRGETPWLLRQRWMIVLGTWSFAFYLVHVLVIDIVHKLDPAMPDIARIPLAYLASTVVAGLMFMAIERPAEGKLRASLVT